jgi:hypothetical protein
MAKRERGFTQEQISAAWTEARTLRFTINRARQDRLTPAS